MSERTIQAKIQCQYNIKIFYENPKLKCEGENEREGSVGEGPITMSSPEP